MLLLYYACTMPYHTRKRYIVLCLCTMHFKNETQKRKLYYVELQNIMAQKNHVVLCGITKYELTLYYVGRNVLFFLFKSIDGLIFFFHSCAVFTIVLMIFPGIWPVIYFTAICSQLLTNVSVHVLCQ